MESIARLIDGNYWKRSRWLWSKWIPNTLHFRSYLAYSEPFFNTSNRHGCTVRRIPNVFWCRWHGNIRFDRLIHSERYTEKRYHFTTSWIFSRHIMQYSGWARYFYRRCWCTQNDLDIVKHSIIQWHNSAVIHWSVEWVSFPRRDQIISASTAIMARQTEHEFCLKWTLDETSNCFRCYIFSYSKI